MFIAFLLGSPAAPAEDCAACKATIGLPSPRAAVAVPACAYTPTVQLLQQHLPSRRAPVLVACVCGTWTWTHRCTPPNYLLGIRMSPCPAGAHWYDTAAMHCTPPEGRLPGAHEQCLLAPSASAAADAKSSTAWRPQSRMIELLPLLRAVRLAAGAARNRPGETAAARSRHRFGVKLSQAPLAP